MVKCYTTTPVYSPVVTLAQAKKQCRIESGYEDEDENLQGYIEAAYSYAEQYLSRPLQQDIALELNNFDVFEVGMLQKADLGSVTYLPEGETVYITLPAENVAFKKMYSGDVHEIRFKDTTGNPLPVLAEDNAAVKVVLTTSCPKEVRQAMLLHIAEMYAFREDKKDVGYNRAMLDLMRPYRVY